MTTPDIGFTPVPAEELQTGQMVYIHRCHDWFKLTADPTRHRFSQHVVVLHFDGLPRPEYRLATVTMHVRDPDPAT